MSYEVTPKDARDIERLQELNLMMINVLESAHKVAKFGRAGAIVGMVMALASLFLLDNPGPAYILTMLSMSTIPLILLLGSQLRITLAKRKYKNHISSMNPTFVKYLEENNGIVRH